MIRLATDDGLISLLQDDRATAFDGSKVIALADRWAVLVDGAVVTVDGAEPVSDFDGLDPWCVVASSDGGAIVGTSKARLFRVTPDGQATPVESFDRIPTRDEWYTPWGAPPDTRSLAITSDGELMVNVHVGGIWAGPASAGGVGDGANGDRWEPVVEVDADVHQVAAAADAPVVVAAAAIGCGVSLDGGHTWRWSHDGLHAPYARAVAIAGDVILVSASTGPGTRSGALYRRGLASDGPFERCGGGLPASFPFNLDTFTVAASADVAVLGTSDGRLFRSADQGASWEPVADDLPAIHAVALA
jgi:hypothetical protein